MNRRLLVVEDEDLIAKSISFAFRREGFEVEIARDGETAIEAIRERPVDAMILDVVLSGPLSGFDVCRAVREESTVPILILSARTAEADKVLGLERGADDYVTKPFSMHELIARIRAQCRRREIDLAGASDGVRRVGDLTIDRLRREVTVAGDPVHLTVSEFAVLDLLSARPNEPVDRAQIVSELWSTEFASDTRTCDAHVRRLRAKIERDPRHPARIVTVRGIGYKLVTS